MQDVVIIGGAVMGSSAAYWLTRMAPGIKVTVLEPDPTYARSATALSVASVRQQFSTAVNIKISRFGIDFIRNFQEKLGLDVGVPSLGLVENGYLFLSRQESSASIMRELAALQNGLGASTEILSQDQTKTRFPWLNCDDIAASSFGAKDEGWFDNMGLMQGFRAAARAQGAVFLKDYAIGLTMSGDCVTGVQTAANGTISCGAAINAAGTNGTKVAAWAGINIPVEPRKRTVFVIDAPNARHPDAPLLIDHGFYLRPEHGQWITATVPKGDSACDANDFEPDLHLFEDVIWEQLYHRAPGFDAVKVIRHWVGHYDYNTLDQNAIIGPHPVVSNLHFMNGFSGHGLQQSPAVGRGVAEHVLHGAWQAIDLSDLSFSRLVQGHALTETGII